MPKQNKVYPDLYRIRAPYFVAGFEAKNNTIIRTAPIIKYMKGWTVKRALDYISRRGWKVKLC